MTRVQMMNEITKLEQVIKNIQKSSNILVVTHEKPDGDAIGSILSCISFFNDNGLNSFAFFPDRLPQNYNQFSLFENIYFETLPENISFDTVIALDCGNFKRLGLGSKLKEIINKDIIVNLDHHFDNEQFGLINYINPDACSTCEILFDIFTEMTKYRISAYTAKMILLGMIMDTGGFRFDNTTSEVLRKVSLLMDFGGDYVGLIKSLFFKNDYSYLQLESDLILNHINWECNNKFIYVFLTPELLTEYNVDKKDIEGLIDTFRTIDGVQVAALITRRENGYKISLRSNNTDYSVVDIAHKLDGGGHKLAAGCFVETESFDKVKGVLLPLVEKLFSV